MEGAGVSIEGAGDGGIVRVGVGAGAGTTCTGGASSVIGTTVADPGIISGVVDRDSLTGSGRNVIEASDQLINGLMRLSQLYPRTRSQGESKHVTKKSMYWTSPEGNRSNNRSIRLMIEEEPSRYRTRTGSTVETLTI